MYDLDTKNSDVKLVIPNVKRDAPISVGWLSGELGRQTLLLMGNASQDIEPPTLKAEQQRIQDFINSTDQKTWMISFKNQIVGVIWADLKSTKYLPAPSVHIMIGNPRCRGKGVGKAAMGALIKYLQQDCTHSKIYSRHLVSNKAAAALLMCFDFIDFCEPYSEPNGLLWQNAKL